MWQRIARLILRIGGWTPIGRIPNEAKAIFIAAPHTSNWDGFWALTYKVAVGLDIHFFAKGSLFWFPLGNLLRGLGGIPLDRTRAHSAVQQAVDMFNESDQFFFGLAPEGTRALRDAWKSGFYRIAIEAKVPVYIGVLDYSKKQVGVIERVELTGDIEQDLSKIATYYEDVVGRWPQKATPIQFSN